MRTSEAIDPATRTLLTEIDVDNHSGALLPGAYAAVHLKLPSAAPSLILPVDSLLFRTEGLQVGVVSPEARVELVSVIVGKDYGTEVEVVSGIAETDRVICESPRLTDIGSDGAGGRSGGAVGSRLFDHWNKLGLNDALIRRDQLEQLYPGELSGLE